MVISVKATNSFLGLCSSVRATHSPEAGDETLLGEALGGVELAILLMFWGNECLIWQWLFPEGEN